MARPFRDGVRGAGVSWRDVAVGLCNILHTPLPDVLRLPIDEAAEWYAACGRFQSPKKAPKPETGET